jgi:hypothetical protein
MDADVYPFSAGVSTKNRSFLPIELLGKIEHIGKNIKHLIKNACESRHFLLDIQIRQLRKKSPLAMC